MELQGPTSVISKAWKPNHRGQEEVLRAPLTVFEILGGGAAGGGKTDLAVLEPAAREWLEHPKYKGLTLRRTFPDLEKEIVPRQREWYAPMGATYNETKKLWTFPSGAKEQNGHAEREEDVRKYDTAEYNRICWEEGTHFTGFQYLYLSLSRCRSSSPDLPAVIRIYTNPGNVGHSFFKSRFVDPCPTGRKLIYDPVTGQKRLYIPFRGIDNPHLLENDPGYLKRLEGLPEQERRAKLLGDWSAYEGQVFSEFRIVRLPSEPENALHVIAPFPIPSWWPKFICIDWGWAADTFIIWAAVAPNGRVYVYRTWKWNQLGPAIWAKEAENITDRAKEQLEDITICHSAGQHRDNPQSIRDQVYSAFQEKYSVNLAPRDRIGGKSLLHEYLRWRPIPKSLPSDLKYDNQLAARILRIKGESSYNDYLKLFAAPVEEDNLPKLQIFSHGPEGRENKELIDCIPSCVPDETVPEDVKQFKGDDPYDCIRMVVQRVRDYVGNSLEAQEELRKREKLYATLRATAESQTAYYRELERMEDDDEDSYSVQRRRVRGSHRIH